MQTCAELPGPLGRHQGPGVTLINYHAGTLGGVVLWLV